jgi:hypothetical protein
MNTTATRPTATTRPTAKPAALRRLRALGPLYRTYAPECWVTLSLAAAVALIAAIQHRAEQQRVEPPPPVNIGSHAQP